VSVAEATRLGVLCGGQALAYLVLVVNMRAVAKAKWVPAMASEAGYALMNFYLLHRIIAAHTVPDALAYTTGCCIGTASAMWVTKHWREQ
jgi:hypothetical protein